MHRFYFFDRQPVREAVDPRRLQFHRVFEGPPSFLSQRDELSSPVMRIDLECDETLFVQVVDDPLHVLTIGTEVASKPRNRLRTFGGCDGAEDLPSGWCSTPPLWHIEPSGA